MLGSPRDPSFFVARAAAASFFVTNFAAKDLLLHWLSHRCPYKERTLVFSAWKAMVKIPLMEEILHHLGSIKP